ncbi:hypothetical protein JOE51_007595 [Bradyrhizobium japonicum]|nr:hypothetical protein [Bradyrhizobium japonicum]BCA03506.1 hypothetical protein H12S4_44100 [Bradyrhizobium diazoefficiens]BCF00073.1 hypothetical protein XF11B_40930 [Bradyrhizobium diazoefficiens]BCF11116.1 hypothetical protein XF12B_64890 [Bradyrhizobium diazoefficiens]
MKKYEFDAVKVRERDYRVFCEKLEDDPSIWFHGRAKRKQTKYAARASKRQVRPKRQKSAIWLLSHSLSGAPSL